MRSLVLSVSSSLQFFLFFGQQQNDQSSNSSTTSSASLPPIGPGSAEGGIGGGGSEFLRLRLQNIAAAASSGSGSGDSCLLPNSHSPRLGIGGPGGPPRTAAMAGYGPEDVVTLSSNVQHLRNEVDRLKGQLNVAQQQRKLTGLIYFQLW